MKILIIFIFICVQVLSIDMFFRNGLKLATDLLSRPYEPFVPAPSDIILSPIPTEWENDTNKLNELKIRLESAWKLIFTDYGFENLPHGVDLVNHDRKIAIELTTEYPITLKSLVEGQQALFLFKLLHPEYETIFGHINSNNESSKVVNGTRFMYGESFLKYTTSQTQQTTKPYLLVNLNNIGMMQEAISFGY